MYHASANWKFFCQLVLMWGACLNSEAYDAPHGEKTPTTGQPSPQDRSQAAQQTQFLQRVRVSQFHMGMMVELTLWAPTHATGEQAAAIAFQRIGALNQIFSDYEPKSELSRLCRQAGHGPVRVSAELFEVLTAARQFAARTHGLYDPTIGPVVRLWREARRTGKAPTDLLSAQKLVGYQKMILDASQQSVDLKQPGMLLDLGSIAKGYVGDEALRVLAEQGVRQAAFEAGGDKVLGDPPPGRSGWLVDMGIPANSDLPNQRVDSKKLDTVLLQLANCAVSVSGDSVQYFERQGQRTSHVILPHTGQGTGSRQMCVVIGPRGVQTDPLATIGTLLPGNAYHTLLHKHYPQVRSYVFPAPEQSDLSPPRIPPP